MTDGQLTLTVKAGALCAACYRGLAIKFRKDDALSVARATLECATCDVRIAIVTGIGAYVSIEETLGYPDLEADMKAFPRAAPRASRGLASGLSVERIVESARHRAVTSARRAVKSEINTEFMRTYKYSDGEKEAASARLRLLAIDMQRAEKADIDNLALHIDSIREGVARGHAAPRPLTDALDSIDDADDADFGLMLLDMVGKARTELGRDDITKSEVANIVGRRGYQISVGEGGVEWVVKRDD